MEILITVAAPAAFVGFNFSALAERDVIIWRQKVGPDHAPTCREDVDSLEPKAVHKPGVGLVNIELIRGTKAERVMSGLLVVIQQHLSPRHSGTGWIIGSGVITSR